MKLSRLYRRTLQLQPDFAEAHNGLGSVYKDQGRLDEAGACFSAALCNCNLTSPRRTATSVSSATSRGSWTKPWRVACAPLQLQPDYATATLNLGTLFRDQGKLDEAVACYQRALQLQPEYPLAHYNLGVVCQGQGKLDEAAAVISAASKATGSHRGAQQSG